MSPGEYKAWIGGLIEGLSGREMTPGALDSLVKRIETNRPGAGDQPKKFRPPVPEDYGEYDGPGAPPPPAEEMVAEAMEPATVIPTPAAPTPTQKKYPPRARKTAGGKLENSTPVADAPPYTPDDPQVVRLG